MELCSATCWSEAGGTGHHHHYVETGGAAETKGGKVTPHFYASDEIWQGESFRVVGVCCLELLFSFLGFVCLLY